MSEAATPETGALSFDQAVAALSTAPQLPAEQDDAPADVTPAEAPEAEDNEPQGGDQTPEEPDAEPEEPAEETETEAEQEAVAPSEPPRYWSKDAKEAFAKLPPDLQAVVLQQEGPREEAAAKAKAEAAEVRKAAEAEIGKVQQLANQLAEFLPQALETFQSRWGDNPDWVAYAEEHGAEAMAVAKAKHEQELAQLQRLAVAKQQADEQAHQAFVKAEFARLAEIAPELADPDKGGERRQAVTKYLVDQGIPADAIRHISAAEMVIAHKARLWDEAQAARKAAPPKKPAPPAPKAPVRPGASATARTPQQRSLEQIEGRLNRSGDIMDAVRLLQAKRKPG